MLYAETKAQLGRWVINSPSKKPLHRRQHSVFEPGSRDLQLQPPTPQPVLATHSLLGSRPKSVSSQKVLEGYSYSRARVLQAQPGNEG